MLTHFLLLFYHHEIKTLSLNLSGKANIIVSFQYGGSFKDGGRFPPVYLDYIVVSSVKADRRNMGFDVRLFMSITVSHNIIIEFCIYLLLFSHKFDDQVRRHTFPLNLSGFYFCNSSTNLLILNLTKDSY